jgi:hypothetical protein
MTTTATKLRQIKEFARDAGVTVRALHFYNRLNLLEPAVLSELGYCLYGRVRTPLIVITARATLTAPRRPRASAVPLALREQSAPMEPPASAARSASFARSLPAPCSQVRCMRWRQTQKLLRDDEVWRSA